MIKSDNTNELLARLFEISQNLKFQSNILDSLDVLARSIKQQELIISELNILMKAGQISYLQQLEIGKIWEDNKHNLEKLIAEQDNIRKRLNRRKQVKSKFKGANLYLE